MCRNIPVIRQRFDDVFDSGSLDSDKRLFVYVCYQYPSIQVIGSCKYQYLKPVISYMVESDVVNPVIFVVISIFFGWRVLLLLRVCRGGQEVAIVYFRNGYMPQNYTDQV